MGAGRAGWTTGGQRPAKIIRHVRRQRSISQTQTNLATSGELNINLGEQLRIKQRAMLNPVRSINAKAGAQGIQAMLGAGKSAPR